MFEISLSSQLSQVMPELVWYDLSDLELEQICLASERMLAVIGFELTTPVLGEEYSS